MKKILYSIFAIALALPAMASAATFTLSPSTGTFKPGDVFSVVVYVTPSAGEEITVAKLSAAFSTDTLEVISFTQADGWMSPASGQFDSLDNATGVFEKMAGFTARVTTQKQFGTVTLKAKKDGTATMATNAESMILDTTNTDKYVASTGATFTIATPAPAPKPKPKPVVTSTPEVLEVTTSQAVTQLAEETKEADGEEKIIVEEDALTQIDTQDIDTSNLAAVSESGKGFFNTKTILIFVGLLILFIFGIFFRRRKSA